MKAQGHKKSAIVPFLVLTILPYLAIGIIGSVLLIRQNKAQHVASLWEEAKVREGEINSFLLKRKTEILFLSKLAHLYRNNQYSDIENTFGLFMESGSPYHAVYLLDTHKSIVARSISEQESFVRNEAQSEEAILRFFDEAIRKSHDEVFTSPLIFHAPYQNLPAHYEPILFLATPAFNANNQKIGLLVGEVSVKSLLMNIKRFSSKFKASPFLVTSAGDYIAHNIASKEWGRELNTGESIDKDYQHGLTQRILSGKPGSFETTPGVLGIFLPVYIDPLRANYFWVIVFKAEPRSAFALFQTYQTEVTLLLLLFSLTLVLIGFFYSKYVQSEQNLERTRNDFVAILTHDLRSPLTNIKLAIDLLNAKGGLPEKLRGVIQRTRGSIQSMARLINDFLDLSKMEAGKIEIKRVETNVRELVERITDAYLDRANSQQVHLHAVMVGDLQNVNVDPDKIERALMNLVDNALKYSPAEGTVIIKAERHGGWLACSVSDSGPGIPDDKIKTVFNKYEQIKDRRHTGGTGLGLPIVKEIVESHGGKIWVQSAVGKGTTFHFRLKTG
jgi:signal transduction histidine kinase